MTQIEALLCVSLFLVILGALKLAGELQKSSKKLGEIRASIKKTNGVLDNMAYKAKRRSAIKHNLLEHKINELKNLERLSESRTRAMKIKLLETEIKNLIRDIAEIKRFCDGLTYYQSFVGKPVKDLVGEESKWMFHELG